MTEAALVMAGGAAGACLRFWLIAAVTRRAGDGFPWGTLAVNVSGSFAIGLASVLPFASSQGMDGAALAWLAIVTGGLGSYTTVSSFSLNTLALLHLGAHGRAFANIAASAGLCLGALLAGQFLGGWLR
ncbi:fluoride efflux transporter FluC [Sabulicella glaciei]|uniref:Fluoride-specific ion channel FluC n=1 Tax=Sabulicella glaciei TaxID=2984948 RepID=A0ABT3NW14_9PROT|nr:CrcB family protein [Roseococcus sp. MDT2-1-1]MCW8086335.1 CrcB family protein [Roseococcus sp. MDT2-1-1]